MIILDVDSSLLHTSSVLSEIQDGEERVLAYFSHTFTKEEQNYCATRKELAGIIVGVKHFEHYLLFKKFVIRSDHASLKWLL